MKVVCIDNKIWFLTIGKIYDVIEEDKDDNIYWLINDHNKIYFYPKELFKLLFEIRNEKINKLLGL